MRGASAVVVAMAIIAIIGACSSDYGDAAATNSSDGGAGDGGSDGPPNANDGNSGGPGCPGCVILADKQDMPTELLLVGSTLFWINVGSNVSVGVSYDLGDGTVAKSEGTYGPGMHDLQLFAQSPWAIDKGGKLDRLFPSYSCPALAKVKRLTSLNGEWIWIGDQGMHRGDCAGKDVALLGGVTGTEVTAVLGDAPLAWYSDAAGNVSSCDASGSQCATTATTVATSQGAVTVMAVDDTRIYWATPGPSSSIRARLKVGTAGGPTDIATAQGDPKTIVPRGGDVYWTDAERGTVMKGSAAGGAAITTIASGLDRPWGLAVGPSDVFVAESAGGRVLKLPR